MGHEQRKEQSDLANERIKGMSFGDEVTNVCAGENNPNRLSFFVRKCGNNVECTDKKGGFWKTGKTVIFKGSISIEESHKLYSPIWDADFK